MYGAGFLIFIIVRIILAARAGEGVQTTGTRPIFFTLLRVLFGIGVATSAIEESSGAAALAAAALLLPGAPVALVSGLGLPVLPFWLTRSLRPWTAAKENPAAAVFWELRARLRFGLLLSPKRVQKLADSLFLMSDPPAARGYTFAAQAIIDGLQGNVEQARSLFNLALDFSLSSYTVRRYSHAFLLAEAAKRGQWGDVLRLARRGPFSMRRLFFRACAEQLTFVRSHSRLRLRVLWLLAPGRRHTLALLQACEQVMRPERLRPGHELRDAFDGAGRLITAPPGIVSHAEIEQVAERWQALLDGGTLRECLVSRMTEQGSGFDVEEALAALEQQVITILTSALAEARPHEGELTPERPFILLAAEDRLQDELLSELESLTDSLELGDASWNADLESLVRRWAEIRSMAQRLFDLFPQSQGIFYDTFGTNLLNHGAWLHNRAAAYPLACDVFRWLSGLAPAGHDDLVLLRGNEKLSRGAAKAQ